jgi:uncharacterized phage protein (TIGR02216 family)
VKGTAAGTPSGSPQPFPWADIMSLGLGVLRLPPSQFWAMTPRELDAALRGLLGPTGSTTAPTRIALDSLMRQFPDAALP